MSQNMGLGRGDAAQHPLHPCPEEQVHVRRPPDICAGCPPPGFAHLWLTNS